MPTSQIRIGILIPRPVQRAREALKVHDGMFPVLGNLDLGDVDLHQDQSYRFPSVEGGAGHVVREFVADGEVESEEVVVVCGI